MTYISKLSNFALTDDGLAFVTVKQDMHRCTVQNEQAYMHR